SILVCGPRSIPIRSRRLMGSLLQNEEDIGTECRLHQGFSGSPEILEEGCPEAAAGEHLAGAPAERRAALEQHARQSRRGSSRAAMVRLEGPAAMPARSSRSVMRMIAMVERAQPLPPIPDTLPQDRLQLTFPVTFALR